MSDSKVIDVPTAGRVYLNVCRDKAYQLAREGVIPTIRIGRKLVVPVAAMERLLEQAGNNKPKAA